MKLPSRKSAKSLGREARTIRLDKAKNRVRAFAYQGSRNTGTAVTGYAADMTTVTPVIYTLGSKGSNQGAGNAGLLQITLGASHVSEKYCCATTLQV